MFFKIDEDKVKINNMPANPANKQASKTKRNPPKKAIAKSNDPVVLPQNLSPKLTNIKKQISSNDVSSLKRLMEFFPVFRNGEVFGIEISPGADRSLFKQLRLQRGDIITSINGIPTNDLNRLLELKSLVASATVFDVRLERKGQMQNLSVILP